MKKLLLVLTLIVACLVSAHSEEKKVLSVTIKTKKGPLSGILTIPPIEKDEKIPVVILCHGFMGNKETPLMQTLVDSLCNSGMATVCFDFDGHGASYGKQQDMTVPRQIDDVLGVFSFASRFPYADKFAIVGHSQGGVAAIMAAAELGESVRRLSCETMRCGASSWGHNIIHSVHHEPLPSKITHTPSVGTTSRLHKTCLSTKKQEHTREKR